MKTVFQNLKKTDWLLAAVCLAFIVVQVWLDLKTPDYMAEITTLVQTAGSTMGEILSAGGMMLVCSLGSLTASVVTAICAARIAATLGATLRGRLFSKVQSFSMEEIGRFSTASLITRSTNDVTQIQMLIVLGLQMLLRAPIMAVFAIYKIAGKQWEWTLATAVAVVVLLVVVGVCLLLATPKFRRMQKLTDDLNRVTRENLTGLRVVRAYNAEDYQETKFAQANAALTGNQLFAQRTLAFLLPSIQLVMSGLSLAIYWIGGVLIDQAGGMQTKLTLFSDMMVFFPVRHPGGHGLHDAGDDLYDPPPGLCGRPPHRGGPPHPPHPFWTAPRPAATPPAPARWSSATSPSATRTRRSTSSKTSPSPPSGGGDGGHHRLHRLRQKHRGQPDPPVLRRHRRPSPGGRGGRAGIRPAEPAQQDWVRLPRRPPSSPGPSPPTWPMGDNGEAPPSPADVQAAVATAQAEDFVTHMEGAMRGTRGPGGANLSGGQKQRLSIARAIARKPEILLFDDAFSALDYKTDRGLRSALDQTCQNTTRIIVAQRIGTIRDADQIIVLDDGQIAGIGKHQDLMQTCGVYQQIALSQLSKEELA